MLPLFTFKTSHGLACNHAASLKIHKNHPLNFKTIVVILFFALIVSLYKGIIV